MNITGLRRWPALVAVLATLLLAGSAPAAAGPPRPLAVGVQFHGMWSDYTDPERVAVLDRLAAAGLHRVRIDVSWATLQPDGPDDISLAGEGEIDHVISLAADRGLRPLVTLWLTPGWANGGRGEHTPPDDPGDFARIAGWAAARWGGSVDWEVWNEPNSDHFFTGGPTDYAALLCAAYPAFKRGDPTTTVVGGSVEYNDDVWLAHAYDAGMHGCFDVLSTHPYPALADQPPDAPDDGTPGTFAHVEAVRTLMVSRGDGDKQIWFTEVGWSTHPGGDVNWQRGVTEGEQADNVVKTLQIVGAELPYVSGIFFYRDRDQVTGDPQFDHYGLLTRQMEPKPALTAIATHLRSGT